MLQHLRAGGVGGGNDSLKPAVARKLQLIQFKILSDCNEEEEEERGKYVCVGAGRQRANGHVSMAS